jgi:hypothetical protein
VQVSPEQSEQRVVVDDVDIAEFGVRLFDMGLLALLGGHRPEGLGVQPAALDGGTWNRRW